MDHKLEASEIQTFILDTLELAGATYRWVDGRLLEAFVPVTRPPSFFGAEQPPYDRLLLAFGDDPRGLPSDAELVTTGSYRLGWFIDGVRKRGKMAKVAVPFTLSLSQAEWQLRRLWPTRPAVLSVERLAVRQHPHLIANFRVSLSAEEQFNEVTSLSIDLETGAIRSGLIEQLTAVGARDAPGPAGVSTDVLRHAFEVLVAEILARTRAAHPGWEDGSWRVFQDDIERLKAYYSDRSSSQIDPEEIGRIVDELREKYRPRLTIAWTGGALASVPVLTFEYTESGEAGPESGVGVYDPMAGELNLNRRTSRLSGGTQSPLRLFEPEPLN